jgi:hypothetical protein
MAQGIKGTSPPCSAPGCDRPSAALGLCRRDYQRWRRRGTTDPRPTLEQRFWAKVNKAGPIPAHRPELGPCWVWTGATWNGYGVLGGRGPNRAHRVAYELLVGPIPEGIKACHHCDNRPCVKAIADRFGPAHLFLGTHADNMADMIIKNRQAAAKITHCPQGHPYTPENSLYRRSRPGRECRICMRERLRKRREAKS